MPQFSLGRVNVTNGSTAVTAAWQAILAGVLQAFYLTGQLRFQNSGARGRVVEHDLAGTGLVFNLEAGSVDPDPTEPVEGPALPSVEGGQASGPGSGTDTLADTAKSWTDDEHNDRYVVLRPGLGTEEWRKVLDTTEATPELQVDLDWIVPPAATDDYLLFDAQTGTLEGFRKGTPTTWLALALVLGRDRFKVRGEQALYQVAAVPSDRELTLAVPYAGASRQGVEYSLERDFTAARNYPVPNQSDEDAAALAGEAISLIDLDVDAILSPEAFTVVGAGGGAPAWENGYAGTAQFRKLANGEVLVVGLATKATPAADETFFTLPAGYRPPADRAWAVANEAGATWSLAFVEVQTDGAVVLRGTPPATAGLHLDAIRFSVS